ncbi:MAG: hypothetical protein WCG27_00025 [Pseudomonadota bacterium]
MIDRLAPKDNIERVLIEALKEGNKLIGWYDTPEGLLRAELKIKSLSVVRKEIVLSPLAGSYFYLKEIITGSGKINFYAPLSGLVFTSEVIRFPEKGPLVVAFPKEHLFDERRQLNRIDCANLDLWINFGHDNKSMRKKCYDISIGGFSVLFAKTDKFPWKEQTVLEQVTLVANSQKEIFTAEILGIHNIDPYALKNYPYGGRRVSFKFLNTSKAQKDFIHQFYNLFKRPTTK